MTARAHVEAAAGAVLICAAIFLAMSL